MPTLPVSPPIPQGAQRVVRTPIPIRLIDACDACAACRASLPEYCAWRREEEVRPLR